MEQNFEGPMETWSDEQVLKAYGYLTGDLPDGAEKEGLAGITAEMRRRGLSPEVTTEIPKSESMEWDGDDAADDPGSGALPDPV